MLLRQTHKIEGHLKLAAPLTFCFGDRKFEIGIDDEGFANSISVTTSVAHSTTPRMIKNEDGAHAADIFRTETDPKESLIYRQLRNLEGLLSVWGIREINLRHFKQEWIPETDEEIADQDRLLSMTIGTQGIRKQKTVNIPPEIILRAVANSGDINENQVVLSFFRKGLKDFELGAYIDAIYDFFFVLEHLYGDGKFRSAQLKKNFKNSASLVSAAEFSKNDLLHHIEFNSPEERKYYIDKFQSKQPEEILDDIVDLRGQLHHHSRSRTVGSWHPEGHEMHRLSAYVIRAITYTICWKIIEEHVFSEKATTRTRGIFGLE